MVVFLVLFVVVPIAELYVFVQASQAIGFFSALGLLIAVTVFGAWLVRHQGLRTWRRLNEQLAQGKVPSREIVDGVLLLLAGALFVAPGFLSDVVAILLLFPPTRALVRRLALRRWKPVSAIAAPFGSPRTQGPTGRPNAEVIDVDSDEIDPG